jgi:hypothetical protein
MIGNEKDENKFIMNEYLEVNVKQDLVQLCSDCYHTLGWTILNTRTGIDSVTLKLQRDRKIKNRALLCDLQRKCEDAFIAIEKLEKSKTTKAVGISIGIGILGTIFMTGSVFAIKADIIPLCIILAIPGFIGWGLAYFIYKKLLKESTEKINPIIDRNYDVIYEACEKACQLLG